MFGTQGSSTYEATHANKNNSTIKTYIDDWYSIKTNLSTYLNTHLADAGFCNDRSVAPAAGVWDLNDTALGYGKEITYYGAINRLGRQYKPQFACPNPSNDLFTTSTSTKGNKALTYPIGLITADEIAYAGGVDSVTEGNFYLNDVGYYWTMSPFVLVGFFYSNSSTVYQGGTDSGLTGFDVNTDTLDGSSRVRPVINLRSEVGITKGNGTSGNPYVIKTN